MTVGTATLIASQLRKMHGNSYIQSCIKMKIVSMHISSVNRNDYAGRGRNYAKENRG